MPRALIIAGPNGAGKTTHARALLQFLPENLLYLNADFLAAGLSPFRPEMAAFDAARLLLRRLDAAVKEQRSFILESTLSGRAHLNRIAQWCNQGYDVEILYLWLPTAELAVARVNQRVSAGGHDVPEKEIRRRFQRSLALLHTHYLPVADLWTIYDGSALPTEVIAHGSGRETAVIQDSKSYSRIMKNVSDSESGVSEPGKDYADRSILLKYMPAVVLEVERQLRAPPRQPLPLVIRQKDEPWDVSPEAEGSNRSPAGEAPE